MTLATGNRMFWGGTPPYAALQILDVRYDRIPVKLFSEPPGAEAAPKTRAGRLF